MTPNSREFTVGYEFEIADLESAFSMEPNDRVTILHSSVSPARRKLASARWLLRQLREHMYSEAAALMFLESLVTMLRSATFTLQKMGATIDGFDAWYETQRETMRADPQLRWLVDVRNAAEKEGLVLTEYGPRVIVRFHHDGTRSDQAVEPMFKVDGHECQDLFGDLEAALAKISAVVEEAHATFFSKYQRKPLWYAMQCWQEKPDGSWEQSGVEGLGTVIVGPAA